MSELAVTRAFELKPLPEAERWLVEGLWGERAVGIVGGEPKCCKSFLALDVAVSVASGTPCLRRFMVPRPGPVLLYAAEDALHIVRERLEGIASAAGVRFSDLEVHVITSPQLRIDLKDDRVQLYETVKRLRPRLLVLDPFVRLHRVDENVSAEVAPLLAYLRQLERRLEVAVLLVHHSRKGATHARAGQALRGSSELHAWGDSNLYLRWRKSDLLLNIEHRAAASVAEDLPLELHEDGASLALRLRDRDPADPALAPVSLPERIEKALAAAAGPLSMRRLRETCRVRTATLRESLEHLEHHGRVRHTDEGYLPGTSP